MIFFQGIRGVSPSPVGDRRAATASPSRTDMMSRTVTSENIDHLKELQEVMERQLMATPKKKKAVKKAPEAPASKKASTDVVSKKKRQHTPSSSSSESEDQMSLDDDSEYSEEGSSTAGSQSSSQSDEGQSEDEPAGGEPQEETIPETDLSHSRYFLISKVSPVINIKFQHMSFKKHSDMNYQTNILPAVYLYFRLKPLKR